MMMIGNSWAYLIIVVTIGMWHCHAKFNSLCAELWIQGNPCHFCSPWSMGYLTGRRRSWYINGVFFHGKIIEQQMGGIGNAYIHIYIYIHMYIYIYLNSSVFSPRMGDPNIIRNWHTIDGWNQWYWRVPENDHNRHTFRHDLLTYLLACLLAYLLTYLLIYTYSI